MVGVGDGDECVGYAFIDQCGTGIQDRIVVRQRGDGGLIVAGSAPAEVEEVAIRTAGGSTTTATVQFAPYASCFFLVEIHGEPLSVQWPQRDGTVVDEATIAAPTTSAIATTP